MVGWQVFLTKVRELKTESGRLKMLEIREQEKVRVLRGEVWKVDKVRVLRAEDWKVEKVRSPRDHSYY